MVTLHINSHNGKNSYRYFDIFVSDCYAIQFFHWKTDKAIPKTEFKENPQGFYLSCDKMENLIYTPLKIVNINSMKDVEDFFNDIPIPNEEFNEWFSDTDNRSQIENLIREKITYKKMLFKNT